ncbi:MAG: glycosyltransferase [Thermogutta sp.]
MRILHVIHSIDPRSGGPSHALRGLVRAQVTRGHQVTVLATLAQSAEPWAPAPEFAERMKSDPAFAGAELILGRAFGRRRPWSRFSYCPHTIRLLRERLRSASTRAEVLHLHGAFSHLILSAARLARRYGIPYVFRPAGSFDASCMKKGMWQWKRIFLEIFHRRDMLYAGAVHVTSMAESRHLQTLVPGCRTVVIPHGIDLPQTDASKDKASFLACYPQWNGHRILLFLSRLHEKKRPSWLMKALAVLRNEFPDLGLIFAGPDAGAGEEVNILARQFGLDGRVCQLGFVQGEEKQQLFAVADVFCLPSQDENFGVAVVEAMAYGVPAVVTPGVASHVYVDAAGCGITADDSLEGVIQAIREVLLADRQELGRRGREYVEKHLAWPIIAAKVEEMYFEVIKQSGAVQS